jgi:antitoxin ParD1/3/4
MNKGMNVSLTNKQEDYIASQIAGGDYQNASELVRDALRLHQIYRNKVIDELRIEIEKSWKAPNSNRSVSDIINAKKKQYLK